MFCEKNGEEERDRERGGDRETHTEKQREKERETERDDGIIIVSQYSCFPLFILIPLLILSYCDTNTHTYSHTQTVFLTHTHPGQERTNHGQAVSDMSGLIFITRPLSIIVMVKRHGTNTLHIVCGKLRTDSCGYRAK